MKPAAARGARETQQARRDGPERSCVVTRTVKSPDDLIRFVVGPDNMLVPDLRRKLPGRGVWASLSAAAVAEAVKRRAFERSLKTKVVVPPDLGEMIDALMLKDALQALAMANKAGLAQAGFAKVEAVIGSGRCAAVIEASDGAEDGRRKIAQALRRAEIAREEARLKPRKVPVVAIFAAADLELALGRAHVIHAALAPGPAAEGFLSRWRRLVRYRTNDAGATAPEEPNGSDPAGDDSVDHRTTEPAGPNAAGPSTE
ncbi:MAG: RNA-binding protein [Bosea sp. (in: a-proteobacteria)]|uniref:RNA-binding protein n=1 Tax=Bosea sp. (in: a-proteobacteria) TaxID=1871050 RepID=UPI0027349F27|nr:RNA-binding protein [Bosea sp. (in: a-proteobacteria)]MDP3601299.1 RNA-binding protein [Bosea sp. (in: a-proteobacteria)]